MPNKKAIYLFYILFENFNSHLRLYNSMYFQKKIGELESRAGLANSITSFMGGVIYTNEECTFVHQPLCRT